MTKFLLIVWISIEGYGSAPDGGVTLYNVGHYSSAPNCIEAGGKWREFPETRVRYGYRCVPVESSNNIFR
jgi:hypothetical protein